MTGLIRKSNSLLLPTNLGTFFAGILVVALRAPGNTTRADGRIADTLERMNEKLKLKRLLISWQREPG